MDKFDNESILYELLEYLVKKQDPELIVSNLKINLCLCYS